MPRPRTRTAQKDRLLALLREARHDHAHLGQLLGGMPPATLSRLLNDLRAEGHPVVAVRRGMASVYMLLPETPNASG